MACEVKVIAGIDRALFEKGKAKLAALGYPIEGELGEISGPMGIKIKYRFVEEESIMKFQVLEKNFLIPCSLIYSKIEEAIDAER